MFLSSLKSCWQEFQLLQSSYRFTYSHAQLNNQNSIFSSRAPPLENNGDAGEATAEERPWPRQFGTTTAATNATATTARDEPMSTISKEQSSVTNQPNFEQEFARFSSRDNVVDDDDDDVSSLTPDQSHASAARYYRPPSASTVAQHNRSARLPCASRVDSTRPVKTPTTRPQSETMHPRARSSPTRHRSVSRRQKSTSEVYLANVDSRIRRRKVPQKFFHDPEDMYIEIQDLKSKLAKSQAECVKLRTALQKTEHGKNRKQRQVEELLRANAIVETSGSRYESLFKEMNVSNGNCIFNITNFTSSTTQNKLSFSYFPRPFSFFNPFPQT